ncbi:PaaI family thioesterase [Aliigemmobacter aestuarii]|uniref:PaaI family thioesterase n=1 Tax=Aliigemmobacter aestuarii TaxID=1445661 RepID=A0A4S3MSH2_9RHOB|nr:PaaI family thioesterase [Gemmobacter aestuarii]THD84401.1 PaaI family thioesterase [Gemmobacter aestuarii]
MPDTPSAVFSATCPADIPPPEVFRARSGLDYMKGVLEGRFPMPRLVADMGMVFTAIEDHRATLRGAAAFGHTNLFGGVHGGWYGTIMDTAMGCAVMTVVPQGKWQTTLEYKVNIMRAVRIGTEVEVTGIVDHAGQTTAVARAEVRGAEDGRLYATASTTCLILDWR